MMISKVSATELSVLSADGKRSYSITKKGCSCPAFKFSITGNCKHFEYAERYGHLDLIEDEKPEPVSTGFTKSTLVIRMRKDAIKQWLENQNLPITEKIVNVLEELMTVDKTEEDLYNKIQECMAEKLKKAVFFNTRTGKVIVSLN